MKTLLKLLLLLFVLGILVTAIGVFGVAFVNKKINEPFLAKSSELVFEVRKGEGASEIAKDLEHQKFIADKNYFLFYLWQSGDAAKLQAGKYKISASESVKEIANKIISGDAIKEEISITIPEGFRLKEIDNRLVGENIIKKGSLQNSLEGYLFPDTYNFLTEKLPLDTEDVVKKFLDNFDKKTNNLKMQAESKNIDFRDIVIMASILEKEVRTPQDMKTVSGLLWRRISIGMPLQVDATIAYVTGKKTGEITYDDLKISSPYNTYLNKGLPPGPISNPGLVSLDAALNPIENDYLYYLSKPTGETVFSKTIEEHNRAKNLYLR